MRDGCYSRGTTVQNDTMLMAARRPRGGAQWPTGRRVVRRPHAAFGVIASFLAPPLARKRVEDEPQKSDDALQSEEEEEEERCSKDEEWEQVAFRDAQFPDEEEEDDELYAPSEDEDDDEEDENGEQHDGRRSVTTMLMRLLPRWRRSRQAVALHAAADSHGEKFTKRDARFWADAEAKRAWVERFQTANADFQRDFGQPIDSPNVRLYIQRSRRSLLLLLVVPLLVVCAVLAREPVLALLPTNRFGQNSEVHAEESVPGRHRAVLDLCASLSRNVIPSGRDASSVQNAVRACDIAVTFAPRDSLEEIATLTQRGDLRSLLAAFDAADEDYSAAFAAALIFPDNLEVIEQRVTVKAVANLWLQLFMNRQYEELYQQVVRTHPPAVRELAQTWLAVFNRQADVLDALTSLRVETLRRLKFDTTL